MRTTLLLTVIGADRTGLVETLAQRIAAAGGNWEESRLVRLAGQFGGLVLVTVDRERADQLVGDLRGLESTGLQVTARVVEQPAAAAATGTFLRLELTGADRPGLVQKVSRILAQHGVNVEELESSIGSAPMSGEALFRARARVMVPNGVALAPVRTALEALGSELMVDLTPE
ncbi:MAG TPA: ACT domain-containing protein [Kofleriaceae bacterium]|nr:ACT domain-containing protein [Kofleriaceae bacterium]